LLISETAAILLESFGHPKFWRNVWTHQQYLVDPRCWWTTFSASKATASNGPGSLTLCTLDGDWNSTSLKKKNGSSCKLTTATSNPGSVSRQKHLVSMWCRVFGSLPPLSPNAIWLCTNPTGCTLQRVVQCRPSVTRKSQAWQHVTDQEESGLLDEPRVMSL
jgi:hypothetical protein